MCIRDRAFSRIAAAPKGTNEAKVADAIRAFPQCIGGTRRDVTALMRGVPGLIAKDGAESVYAVGLDDGRAIALKIADGGQRARPIAVSYTHLRAHETVLDLVCRLLLD